jgi:AmmeMemoRadiSam system protein B
VQIIPIQRSGETLLCLQDPENISEKTLFLSAPLYFIISLFDGRHSVRDIQAKFMRQYGEILYTEKVEKIIDQLEEYLFLEGDRFDEAQLRKKDDFMKSPLRRPVFAGKSYEGDPAQLTKQLDGYFEKLEDPGTPHGQKNRSKLKGVIAPHIDFQRGGFCYAFAHRELKKENPPDCFIILGISHAPMEHPFCLTRKDFETPLGSLRTHQGLIDAVQSRCSCDLFKDELNHRSEHSIEFQTVFLRYLYPDPAPLKIIPVLCGSFDPAMEQEISPMELKPIQEFIESLRESVSASNENVCYLASADLSHMGLQFGDREGVGEYNLQILEEEDRVMLKHVEKMDAEVFFQSIVKEKDRRRVCGVPAIYTLLKALDPGEGRLLKYGQAFTPETQSVVSFASLSFYSLS